MDLLSNRFLFGVLLVACLWAPVYLVRKGYALFHQNRRSLADYVPFLSVLAGLGIVYSYVLDFNTRIMLGVPSLILVTAYLAVTLLQRHRKGLNN